MQETINRRDRRKNARAVEPMMKKRFDQHLAVIVFFLVSLFGSLLYADSSPLEQFKNQLASLQQVLNDPKLAGADHLVQRRNLAKVILREIFDFDEMARRSLGRNARTYSNRLGEFTPLFVDILERSYMGIIEDNGDAKIQYDKEFTDGKFGEINTKAKLKNSKEVTMNYKLMTTSSRWQVYDVVIEGISIVNNYRSQFERVLNKRSFDELLQDLRDKKNSSKQ